MNPPPTPYFANPFDENAMATSPLGPPLPTTTPASNRRILGEVSTNQKIYPSSPAPWTGKRALTGSPLKRGFTQAADEGYGFTYLKKRRISSGAGQSVFGGPPKTPARAQSVPSPQQEQTLPQQRAGEEFVAYSPTEPNTPSDSGGETQGSFSDLIDYDPASQQRPRARARRVMEEEEVEQRGEGEEEKAHQVEQRERQDEALLPPSQPIFDDTSAEKVISHAETLRLRLRVAMYKVQTDQVHVPFSQLAVEKDEQAEAARKKQVNAAVEEAVAALRREAMERMPPAPRLQVPRLAPGPELRPTETSSRMVGQPQQRGEGSLPATGFFSVGQPARPGSVESAGRRLLGMRNGW